MVELPNTIWVLILNNLRLQFYSEIDMFPYWLPDTKLLAAAALASYFPCHRAAPPLRMRPNNRLLETYERHTCSTLLEIPSRKEGVYQIRWSLDVPFDMSPLGWYGGCERDDETPTE